MSTFKKRYTKSVGVKIYNIHQCLELSWKFNNKALPKYHYNTGLYFIAVVSVAKRVEIFISCFDFVTLDIIVDMREGVFALIGHDQKCCSCLLH